jgi:hypothetical protein
MIQINPGLIQLFVVIEALLIIIWGVVKGDINMRRLVFAGSAVIFAFVLPWVLSHLVPGFGSITTYQLLQRYAEHSEGKWASVYWWSSKVMLAAAGAMAAINTLELIGTLGGVTPLQQLVDVWMSLGWIVDPITAFIEGVNHAAQILLAIYHTIAWLAWFSWAVAPSILGIALVLIVLERTRPAGTALLLLTLAIMFFTALAASTLGLGTQAQLNSINQTLTTIEGDLPSNVTIRGYLILQGSYPYFVSGQLMNETMVCGRACYYEPSVVSWFMGFTPSVGLIDQFAKPQINNATLLWLEVPVQHQCNLLVWPPNRNLTQGPEEVEHCPYQYFGDNETFAEEIIIEGPPFNLIGEELPNGTVYTGAWEWVAPPSTYSVSDGNNTVTINATITIPPHCFNITNPRTGVSQRICHSNVTADLWVWASSINYPTSLGGANWTCTLNLETSHRYKRVDLTNQFNTIRTFMDKLINETEVSRELIYPNASIPTYKLPNPTPNGYRQMELTINCINWNNYSVTVPITIVIHGVSNNPWFGSVPFLISPSDAWIINSPIIGDEPLLINWWNTEFKKILGFYGFDIPQWLGELAIIYGLLDGAAWFFGLPTILSPVYSIMQGVIMELSLVLYLQIRAIGRLMQRAVRKITKSIGTRLQGRYQALSNKHPKLAKALTAPSNAVSRARQALHGHLGAWAAHHRVVKQVLEKVTSPTAARAVRIVMHPWHYGWSEVEARLEERRRLYESMGLRRKARLYRFAAGTAKFVRDYGKIRSLSERGLLFEYTRRELSKLGEEPTQLSQSLTKEGEGGLVTYRLSPQSILLDWPRQVRRVAPLLARITSKVIQAEVENVLEELLGRNHPAVGLVENLARTGNYTAANAIVLGKAVGARLIRPLQAEVQLIKEELGEVGEALRGGRFAIRHINDKTIIHFSDARLTHILESLKSFSGYKGDVGEALGKLIEGARLFTMIALVKAPSGGHVMEGLKKANLVGEFSRRFEEGLEPIRGFVRAVQAEGRITDRNHLAIQNFVNALGPRARELIDSVFNTWGEINENSLKAILHGLKPEIVRYTNETRINALRKAAQRAGGEVMADVTLYTTREELLNEIMYRISALREFMELARRNEAVVSMEHPVIKQFIDFLGPESERVVREVFNAKGLIDKDAANEIINRLKPLVNRRVNEEVEAAKYLVAVRHHADEIIKEFARELGVEKRIGEIEGEIKEHGEFVRRVTMSTLPMPRERITNPEIFGEFRDVGGGRVVLREPLNMDIRIDLQTPKEILNDPGLSQLYTAWLVNYLADRLHGWFVRSPGDAIYYASLYKALTPEAEVLAILFASGIDPARLDWGGLLDERERIEERMDRVRAQLKESKDEGEKAKLREELNELREEYERVLKVLFHWANASKAFLSTLPSEERERIYWALPDKLRDFIDTARDPRDVYEAYVKGVALKIEGMKREMSRRSGRRSGEGGEEEGGWVRIDDVVEMRELIRGRLPMLDRLIEPVRAEVIDALTRRVGELISELGNDQFVRNMLEQARQDLSDGNLDNAVRRLRNAIENLRQVARENEELAHDVGRLDELTKQLETIEALGRLARG